jgi:hypothetical protein
MDKVFKNGNVVRFKSSKEKEMSQIILNHFENNTNQNLQNLRDFLESL